MKNHPLSLSKMYASVLKAFIAGLWFVLLGASGMAMAAETSSPLTQNGGVNHIWVGASYTDPLHLLVGLAERCHHNGYNPCDITILGSPLSWNWNHPDTNKWPEKMDAKNKWDYLTLLVCDAEDAEFAVKFAGEAYKGNPKCQVLLYTTWPMASDDFLSPPEVHSVVHGEKIAAAIAKAFPNSPKPRVIPLSMLIRDLGLMADRGELPNAANRFAMHVDGNHLSDIGMYAANVLVCAMLYNESPLDYPSDIFRGEPAAPVRGPYQSVTVPEETAAVIKRTVWDILQTYPPAGMKPVLAIATRYLPPVIAGQPYKVTLDALNAPGDCTWTLTKGTLPAGITLSSAGILAGQSTAVGRNAITIRLTTGKDSIERPLVLSVQQDVLPSIPDQTLPTVALDAYVFKPLAITGGVGSVTWSLSDGRLPCGMMLTPAGALVGTPGQEGEFTFKIKAADSHPAGSRTTEKQFTWKIGPVRPDTLQVNYVIRLDARSAPDGNPAHAVEDKTIQLDGKLDESFWKVTEPIQKKVLGTPEKRAFFSAVYMANTSAYGNPGPGRYELGKFKPTNAMFYLDPTDLVIAIKVLDGPKGKTPKDGIHIFLDSRHEGKVIYGADDMHFFVPREGQKPGQWVTVLKGLKPNWFTKAAVAEIDGGYTVEVSLHPFYFIGSGQWMPFAPRTVYGLDIAVDEGTDKALSQQVWRGDAHDAEDTSHFGTIVLTNQSAIEGAGKAFERAP